MSVQSINFLNTGNNTNKAINSSKLRHEVVKYSGYGALGLGIASGIAAKNKKFKFHTKLAYLAGVLSLVHIGIIETSHFKRKKDDVNKQS